MGMMLVRARIAGVIAGTEGESPDDAAAAGRPPALGRRPGGIAAPWAGLSEPDDSETRARPRLPATVVGADGAAAAARGDAVFAGDGALT